MSEASNRYSLEDNSETLLDSLVDTRDGISWAQAAINVFQVIEDLYGICSRLSDPPKQLEAVLAKINELEKYLVLDLEKHITICNGRLPFYLGRIQGHLDQVQQLIQCITRPEDESVCLEASPQELKELDHLAAEFQATFIEYGFCLSMEPMPVAREALQKLDGIASRIGAIEKAIDNEDAALAFADLHDVIAQLHGLHQAVREDHLPSIQDRYNELTGRIEKMENDLCKDKLGSDSPVFKKYIESQKLLSKTFIDELFKSDPSETINNNMIHPGTRGWLLERVHRWFHSTPKRVFYLSGKTGAGKTAMASAICKLYGSDVVASHFFEGGQGDVMANTVEGLIQALAEDMCKGLPDYVQYLDDKYGGAESNLTGDIDGPWKQQYEVLLKQPLQHLYGTCKFGTRRKLIVVDGLDECSAGQWQDIKEFLSLFMKDMPVPICMFVTVRTKFFPNLIPLDEDQVEGIQFESRAWMNRHIKDIEIYITGSMGAVLSGEDQGTTPNRARADEMTLQNTGDELLKCSSGRFDYAISLMESFAKEMSSSGQFLSSVKKAMQPIRQQYGNEFEMKMTDFASPFRAYRDKEGRSVNVRVLRQSQYLMDKSRVALIRGRHKNLQHVN